MIRTLLIDLDDTLLRNDMGVFLPAYFQRLGEHLAPLGSREKLIEAVMHGTRAMLSNLDPRLTLEQAFWQAFLDSTGGEREQFEQSFEDFYAGSFEELKALTEPMAGAKELVQAALERGLQIVIATNPLFPRAAIERRLSWAGLSEETARFTMLSSLESSHFAKPHLSYYAEMLAKLGENGRDAAMIGNDPGDDLDPAQALGLAVYQLSETPNERYEGGSMAGVLPWLKALDASSSPLPTPQPRPTQARLRAALAAALTMTDAVRREHWGVRLAQDSWAPVEILCHLRDVDLEVNRPRLERILAENEAFISAAHPDRWAQERDYLAQSGPDAVCSFTKARIDLIGILERLTEEQWAKPARHALLGPTTLVELMSVAADHDLLHLAQLRHTLAGAGVERALPHAS